MKSLTGFSIYPVGLTGLLIVLLFSASCGGNGAATSADLELDKITMKGKPPPKPPPEPADPAITYYGIGGGMMVMDADGSNKEKVYNVAYPAGSWSPDGSKLAFRNSTTYLYNSIYTINLDGSGLFEVISYDDIGVRGTAWSPAPVPDRGTRIAYSYGQDSNDDIWLISPDGGTPENITNTLNRFEFENNFTWSSDATRGAYTKSFRADPEVPGLTKEMWVHDFTTGEATRVDLGGPFSNSDITMGSLDWARTQDKIAFQAVTSEPDGGFIRNGYEIWVVDLADPANPVALTNDPSSPYASPSWSPDDTELVYQKGDIIAGAICEIWKMNADGSGKTLVAKPAKKIKSVSWPDWKR